MDYQKVPLTHSIGLELLKKIFGVYCIAALLITLSQAWLEYSQTKERVLQLMMEHQPLVEEGLATAVWHLDEPLLESLLKGIISQRIIVGVQVFNDDGSLLATAGDIPNVQTGSPTFPENQQASSYRYPFKLADPTELSTQNIGLAIFHSDNNVVIEEVQPRLIALLGAAIIKTVILWLVFIYFGQKLLSQPLMKLMATVRQLPLDNQKRHKTTNHDKLNELQLFELALIDTTDKLELTLQSLRDSNDKLSKVNTHLLRAVEQSPTLTVILTPGGQVQYATPSFLALTGQTKSQIQQLFNDELLTKIGFSAFAKLPHQQKHPNQSTNYELTISDKNHQNLYLTANLTAIYSERGSVDSFLFSATNISKNKKLQFALKQKNIEQQNTIANLKETKSQLLQSEKMASIGLLAAGVAHEINNPIAFINSNTHSLGENNQQVFKLIDYYKKQFAHLLDENSEIAKFEQEIDFEYIKQDTHEMISESIEGLNRIKKIVQDLLCFSRTDDNNLELFDLHQGLESTLGIAAYQLKYNSDIIREYSDIPNIECLPSQINQVFLNLIINASQSFVEKGVITIRTKTANDSVVIEIEDNGSGIDKKNMDKLFDPFFTTKDVSSGTGLGLSVSYGIIKQHQGKITVTSEPGKGTCFTLVLPISQSSQKATPTSVTAN